MTPDEFSRVCRVCMIENGEIDIFINALEDTSLIHDAIVMLTSLKVSFYRLNKLQWTIL